MARVHEVADWRTYQAQLLWTKLDKAIAQEWLDAIEAPPTLQDYVAWLKGAGRREAVEAWARVEASDEEYRDITHSLAAKVAFLSGLFPHWSAFVAFARRRLSLKDWPRDVPQPSWGDEEPDWGDSSAAPPAK